MHPPQTAEADLAINVAQSYVTKLYPEHGFNSIALIYALFILSSIVAPYLTDRVPLGVIFLLAALQYAIFILGLNLGVAFVYIGAALVGLAAGCLWIHQGYYVAVASSSFSVPVGKLTSVFLTIYTLNMVLGNTVSLIVLGSGIPITTLLYIMVGMAVAGALILFFLPRPFPTDAPSLPSAAAAVAEPPLTLPEQLGAMLRLCVRRPLADAIPLILWNGSLTTLAFANFPTFVPKDAPESLHPSMFLAYGITGSLLSPLWGRAYDRYGGAKPLVAGIFVLSILTFAFTYWCILGGASVTSAVWVAAMGALGALDNATNCLIQAFLTDNFPRGPDVSPAFGVYRVLFSIGTLSLALVSNSGAWQVVLGISHVLMVATMVTFVLRIVRERRNGPAERGQMYQTPGDEGGYGDDVEFIKKGSGSQGAGGVVVAPSSTLND
ncbi:major facilitator superfamily domain-containing protein [Catenaria anguillulae PL171]|uniref:UNC93-like protein MFSD11 n=1 Tax=Catenaria anguillulae PL171 TaxID=765915 RepID=A0A1Y2H4A5_9FUNG|nr:major facilitator superfamily domain-containing protein [Catenaria anguillulae PL171]